MSAGEMIKVHSTVCYHCKEGREYLGSTAERNHFHRLPISTSVRNSEHEVNLGRLREQRLEEILTSSFNSIWCLFQFINPSSAIILSHFHRSDILIIFILPFIIFIHLFGLHSVIYKNMRRTSKRKRNSHKRRRLLPNGTNTTRKLHKNSIAIRNNRTPKNLVTHLKQFYKVIYLF